MATHGGAADNYYTNGSGQPLVQSQMQYPPQAPYNNGPQYQQAPPNYGDNYQSEGPNGDGKQSFDQAFKLVKPKFNDLWAGVLVCWPPDKTIHIY